eukprot:1314775-Prymnesium_polylepis.1
MSHCQPSLSATGGSSVRATSHGPPAGHLAPYRVPAPLCGGQGCATILCLRQISGLRLRVLYVLGGYMLDLHRRDQRMGDVQLRQLLRSVCDIHRGRGGLADRGR